MTHDSPLALDIDEIKKDMDSLDERLPFPRHRRASIEPWEYVFLPRQYAADHPNLNLKDYQLDDKKLKIPGVEVTKLRNTLRDPALRT